MEAVDGQQGVQLTRAGKKAAAAAARERGAGKPKGKARAKPPAGATQEHRTGPCDLFCGAELVVLMPRQRGCEDCFRDLETMRRDAKAAGAKAIKWLKQAEKKGNEEQLHEFWSNWIKVVGPRQGRPRTGVFPIVQYVEFVEHRSGRRNEQIARMLTKKQFIQCYVDKGMEPSWGEKEWNRRLTDDGYAKDTDPECGLLTMAATVHVQAITFSEYAKGRRIDQKSKEKKAAPGEAESMIGEGFLEENMADLSSPSKAKAVTNEQLLGLTGARATAQESFWQDPLEAALDKEEADASAAAAGPQKKKQRTTTGGDNSSLELDIIEVKGKIDRLIKAAFVKVEASRKASLEELQKSTKNRASYEDTFKALQSRCDCIVWVLDNTEDEFQESLTQAIDAKQPLPVGETMLQDLHSKACFEATSRDR